MSDLSEACSEARAHRSIELDEELAELDAARLRAHLNVCPECALWADRAGTFTVLLREAKLEEPAATYPMPARPVRLRHAGAVAGTAAAVMAVALAVASVTFTSARHVPSSAGLGASSAMPGITCSACDVARAFGRADFADAVAPVSPRSRRSPAASRRQRLADAGGV